jgi:SAM-dependent methyltransferase
VEPRDPIPSAQTQTQDEVVEVYNQLVPEFEKLLGNWEYMTSKQLSDSALLQQAEVDGADVLNLGCSFPLDEIAFAHRTSSWVATDLGEQTIRVAEEAARRQLSDEVMSKLTFEVADATALPYEDASFDVTVSFSTVDHVPSAEGRQRFVDEMARVTRPGGRVVLTVPNRWNRGYANRAKLLGPERAPTFYEYCFSPPEIRGMVRSAGLEIRRFTSTAEIPVLAPRLLLPRLQQRPLLRLYNRVAREFGVRMGVLAVKR